MQQAIRKKNGARSARQIFAMPALVGILSGVGLVAALIGDGPFDVASWVALAAPIILVLWFTYRG